MGFRLLLLWGILLLVVSPGLAQAQTVEDVDVDGSGKVDLDDFLLFVGAFGSARPEYDFDRNGMVNFGDFLVLAAFFGHEVGPEKFTSIALGTAGGVFDDNLTSFLLAPARSSDFIALDAGVLLTGIRRAVEMGSFGDLRVSSESDLTPEGWVLQNWVKGYFITHPHLDHVSGMVVASTDDVEKPVLGLASTIDAIRDYLFNWRIWPNFGDEGEGPLLAQYHYVRLTPGEAVPIPGTEMTVEPYALSHGGVQSTAFLIQSGGFYALFFGDTGPDSVEGGDHLVTVWTRIAPLLRDGKLRGIFIEVSYPDPVEQLYGHLTPAWMMLELHRLADLVDAGHPQMALRDLKVVVTHIKPSLQQGAAPREQIAEQLIELNDLGVHFVFPQQGERIVF